MLLEMQSAMNNMMNNSQLHNSQALPIDEPLPANATEPTSEDAGPAPSCSPSSQSDSSSDPEPTVAMDTSPSSASPSASDSGEEEVIGSVTRAHQETFMYNQEQSSLTAEAPHPTGPLNGGSANTNSSSTNERQDAWNHHNNLITMKTQDPPANLDPQGQEDNAANHCPFRMSRSAATGQCPAYMHRALRVRSTEGQANSPYSGPQWRGGNRMHLVRHPAFTKTFQHTLKC